MLDAVPEPHPAMELTLRWLAEHAPPTPHLCLAHRDFRTGNFLVTAPGLSAVLDWEFSGWGAPEEDLAWISVRDWRFGRLDHPIGGFARRDAFYAAYERASGHPVDRVAVHWWEVMGNLRWGLGCLAQRARYTSGQTRDLEMVAIGRRAAEMEYEALRLIERGEL
jgi:aminoglycoside phosphotransferase (APT) family kinase protein